MTENISNNIVNNVSPSEIVQEMSNVSVLVVGDIMLDKFVYGSVDRISPESPVPVLSISREDKMLGGAANALASLAGLGVQGHILSVIGCDDHGTLLKEKMSEIGVSSDNLVEVKDRPTTVKTRYLAGHQQLLRADYENKSAIGEDIAQDLLSQAEALMPKVQAVILSDYDKGLLVPSLLRALIDLAKSHNVPVIVDPKGQDYSIYAGASAVTPNKKELCDATRGMAVSSDEEVIAAASHLIDVSGVEAVIATRSKDGITVVQDHAEPVHLRTVDIEVFDVSGAGDVVIATIAASVATGATLADAAALANVAGGIAVSKVGTTPIRADELLTALKSDDGDIQTRVATGLNAEKARADRVRQSGLSSWQEAADQVKRWKARGLKVGLTNGCFDILHYGHVNYLNEARERCDRLIVALNKDSSVQVLKGPERPVHDEQSRASVLGALGSVDMVALFGADAQGDDNTANALIAELQPDIYFKGGDYTVDQIPEAPGVMAYGGVVDVMPVYEGHSTTGSIEKMKSGKAA